MPNIYTLSLNNLPLQHEQILSLTNADFDTLICEANRVRKKYHGNRIHLCSIVNARSGLCSEDCSFCAQSSHHKTDVKTHKMISPEKLVDELTKAEKFPINNFGIVTSGRNAAENDEQTSLLKGLKSISEAAKSELCVSIGGIDEKMLKKLYNSGVRRIHHNLETSRNFYPEICSTHTYDERLENIKRALSAGFEICCGGLFGIGESWEDRVELAIEIRDLGIQSIPLNFLNPCSGTPLENMEPLSPKDILRIIAIFRLTIPTAQIKVAGGREKNLRDLQSWIFKAGATSMMIGNYLTVEGRNIEDDLKMIRDLGLDICHR